jgi:hypothetical protein
MPRYNTTNTPVPGQNAPAAPLGFGGTTMSRMEGYDWQGNPLPQQQRFGLGDLGGGPGNRLGGPWNPTAPSPGMDAQPMGQGGWQYGSPPGQPGQGGQFGNPSIQPGGPVTRGMGPGGMGPGGQPPNMGYLGGGPGGQFGGTATGPGGKGGMPPSIPQNLAGRTQPGKGSLPQGGYVGGGQMGVQQPQPGKGGMPQQGGQGRTFSAMPGR